MTNIIIIGRSNVGKSALFNLLSQGARSIVRDNENLTRDSQKTLGALFETRFNIIDTPGISYNHHLSNTMNNNVKFLAQNEADIIFFVIDNNCGITNEDTRVFNEIKKLRSKIILLANKCDHEIKYEHNLHSLGIENIFYISALYKQGFEELHEYLKTKITTNINKVKANLRIAIIGKPNVGKSSYINRLLNNNNNTISDIAGTTRDAVEQYWEYKNNNILITDTAGIYRNKSQHFIDKISIKCTQTIIKYSNIVVLVVDAEQLFGKNDWRILNHAVEEGRGVVIVVNKCDLIDLKKIQKKLNNSLSSNSIYNIPVFYISAKNKKNLYQPINKCIEIYNLWSTKLATNKLNNWLQEVQQKHKHKMINGRNIKFKYIVQSHIKPIRCKIFCNIKPTEKSYISYLSKSFAKYFKLSGFHIRFDFILNEPYKLAKNK